METRDKPFLCQRCASRFTSKAHLEIHESFHDEEKPYKCLHCEMYFKTEESCENHVRVHTGEKPFTCPQCGKRFTFKGNLRVHVRLHTGEMPFTCPQCEKQFRYPRDLKRHMKLHSGEYVYACCVCVNGFPDAISLKYHHRTHSKRHKNACRNKVCWCSMCGERAKNTRAQISSKHANITSREKTDSASPSGIIVTALEMLNSQQTLQTGGKTHPCPSCGMHFSSSIYMLAHVKKCRPKSQ